MPRSSVFVNLNNQPQFSQMNCSLRGSSHREKLLKWYLGHKRSMPWRAEINAAPNPYYVLVSEFMLQQTTVQTVIPYFDRFIERFPTLNDLASSCLDDVYSFWQGLGYYSRAKNLHQAAIQIQKLESFPNDIETLQTLPGIGPYTSASIAAIAFDRPVMPIDGNVMRVVSRLFILDEPKGPKLHTRVKEKVQIFAGINDNTHSAQALMELGALICKPRNPSCQQCPLSDECKAFQNNSIDKYPQLVAKPVKPKRTATAYYIINESDQVLVVKRPDKGLFANMFVFPTDMFDFDSSLLLNFVQIEGAEKPTEHVPIKHIFSHFDLELSIIHGKITGKFMGESIKFGSWVSSCDLKKIGMPTLMRKVIKAVQKIN